VHGHGDALPDGVKRGRGFQRLSSSTQPDPLVDTIAESAAIEVGVRIVVALDDKVTVVIDEIGAALG
jgi:hypothetical protein